MYAKQVVKTVLRLRADYRFRVQPPSTRQTARADQYRDGASLRNCAQPHALSCQHARGDRIVRRLMNWR